MLSGRKADCSIPLHSGRAHRHRGSGRDGKVRCAALPKLAQRLAARLRLEPNERRSARPEEIPLRQIATALQVRLCIVPRTTPNWAIHRATRRSIGLHRGAGRIGWRDSSRITVRRAFAIVLAGEPPTLCWDCMLARWPWPMSPRAIGILGRPLLARCFLSATAWALPGRRHASR